MFTVVQVESAGRRSRMRLRRMPPVLSNVSVPGGSPFYILRDSGRTPPQELFRLAARCAPFVLTDLEIPPNAHVRRFDPHVFLLRYAANTLIRLLAAAALAPQTVTLGICDLHGALHGQVCAFLRYAAEVRIVTQNVPGYDMDVRCAARDWGAGLTVGDNPQLLRGCTIVLYARPCPPVDAPFRFGCAAAPDAFIPQPPCLPPLYTARRPDCVPPEQFAAALAELCGVHVLEQCACPGLLRNAEAFTLPEAADLWRVHYAEIVS